MNTSGPHRYRARMRTNPLHMKYTLDIIHPHKSRSFVLTHQVLQMYSTAATHPVSLLCAVPGNLARGTSPGCSAGAAAKSFLQTGVLEQSCARTLPPACLALCCLRSLCIHAAHCPSADCQPVLATSSLSPQGLVHLLRSLPKSFPPSFLPRPCGPPRPDCQRS